MPIEPGNFSLGVLAGGLIGTLAGHYLTKSRNSEERKICSFNKAATEYLCAFTSIIITLTDMENEGNSNAIMDCLLAECIAHRNAIAHFKLYLAENERTEIEKAWDEYCYDEIIPGEYEPRPSDRFYKYSLDYTPLAENYEKDFDAKKQLALDSINRLLDFAKLL